MAVFIKGAPRVDPRLEEDQVLWRYLDTAKFLDFLHTQTLYFTRGDQLQDKFEGTFTNSIRAAIEQAYLRNNVPQTYEQFKARLRESVFVNCWHASGDDSMAMWSLYGRSSTAVAITTTVGKLKFVLKEAKLPYLLTVSKVDYVKHWRDPELVVKPYSNVFAYKVKAYEYEKEVRVIIDLFDEVNLIEQQGIAVPVQAEALLRSIVVSPEAPSWFYNLVNVTTVKYGMLAPVRRSMLASDPT